MSLPTPVSALDRPPPRYWESTPGMAADFLAAMDGCGFNDTMREWTVVYVEEAAGRTRWDVEYLVARHRFSRCLNIGGAPFYFEYLMKRAAPGTEIVSADLNPERFPQIGQILGLTVAPLNVETPDPALAASLGKFECVCLCEVFEHLRHDLLGTMSFIRSLMTEDGILYLTTPNGLGLTGWLRLLRDGRTGPSPVREWSKIADYGHMGHVREYSAVELREVLEYCGLRVEQLIYRQQLRRPRRMLGQLRRAFERTSTTALPSLGNELIIVARNRPAA